MMIRIFLKSRLSRVYEKLQLLKMNLQHWIFVTMCPINRELLRYKDKYIGKRCFIVATGPSLTVEDLNKIKREITFGVNTSISAVDKSDWRPTFLCITDKKVWNKIGDVVIEKQNVFSKAFILSKCGASFENKIEIHNDRRPSTYIETDYYKRTKKYIRKYDFYLSKDMDRYFCDGPTVIFTVIQLAIYMGFTEIHLIGTDCNYSGEKLHSDVASYGSRMVLPIDIENKLFGAYRAVNRDIDIQKLNVKVYNCTRGGSLEVFSREKLESVLEK